MNYIHAIASACRRRSGPLSILLVAIIVFVSAGDAEAQRGRRGRRSAAAAAAARKKQAIATLQQRLNVARQVLAAAEGQTRMSQAEVDQAVSKLSQIRSSLAADEQEAAEAAKSLHEIEDAVLDQSSEYRLALEGLDAAKEDLHKILHDVAPIVGDCLDVSDEAGRLAHMAKLTNEDRRDLAENKEYQTTLEALQTRARNVAEVRQKLLRANPEWSAARQEAGELASKLRQERAQATAAGLGSLDDRRTLRTAKSVAAEARITIAQCEALLKRLGAVPAAPQKSSGSNGKAK